MPSKLKRSETYLIGFNFYEDGTMNAIAGTKTPGQDEVYIHRTYDGDDAYELYRMVYDRYGASSQ